MLSRVLRMYTRQILNILRDPIKKRFSLPTHTSLIFNGFLHHSDQCLIVQTDPKEGILQVHFRYEAFYLLIFQNLFIGWSWYIPTLEACSVFLGKVFFNDIFVIRAIRINFLNRFWLIISMGRLGLGFEVLCLKL